MNIFTSGQRWLKGNLHTHTTISDGQKSPQEVIALYKKQGYDFLAITDHRKFFPASFEDDFLVIAATELHCNYMDPRIAYHITGTFLKEEIFTDDSNTPQEIIDKIHAAGGFATIAHPEWSLMRHEDLFNLNDFDAIEIYNGISDAYCSRGYSSSYLDVLATRGVIKRLTAVDDVHFYDKDLFTGFIMVNAAENSSDAIQKAILANEFYASQAPIIHSIDVSNGVVTINTSKAKEIVFLSDTFFVHERVRTSPNGLTTATYNVLPTDNWLRIEVVDEDGKKAWSNYINIK